MGGPDLGPGWFWALLAILTITGFIAVIIWIVQGIAWAIHHIHIV